MSVLSMFFTCLLYYFVHMKFESGYVAAAC